MEARSGAKGARWKLMETIVEDVIKAKAMPFAQWQALSANPLVPLAISVVPRRSVSVTQVGVDAAHAVTAKLEITRSLAPDN